MKRDPVLARMCRMNNSDDSGIGISVPDVPYPWDRPQTVDPSEPIDTPQDQMRKLQAIYNDSRTKAANKIRAMQLHRELQQNVERENAYGAAK